MPHIGRGAAPATALKRSARNQAQAKSTVRQPDPGHPPAAAARPPGVGGVDNLDHLGVELERAARPARSAGARGGA